MDDQQQGAAPPHPDLGDPLAPPVQLPGQDPAPGQPLVPRPTPSGLAKPPAALAKRRKAPDPIREALLQQLKTILEKPLEPKMLLELEQTARLAQQLLVVAGDSRAIPRRRGRGPYGGGLIGPDPYMGDVIAAEDLDDDPLAMPVGGPMGGLDALVGAPGAENFGAAAIREMMSEAKAPRIDNLMRSLEIAEKNDMTEIADKLRKRVEAQLGMGQDEDVEPVLALPGDLASAEREATHPDSPGVDT